MDTALDYLKRIRSTATWVMVATWLFTAAMLAVLIFMPSPRDAAVTAKCDQAVAALLESRDPIELQRADILIRNLDCSIRKRLPRES